MTNLIQKLIPLEDLKATVWRFPLSVMCGVLLFGIAVATIHEVLDDEEIIGKIAAFLGCCYFWFGIAALAGESRGWPRIKAFVLSAVGAGGIAAVVFLSPVWWMHLLFLLPALLLLIMVAPYMTRGGDDRSFWMYNRSVWTGVVASYASILLFSGGLAAALFAVDELFGVDIDSEIYGDIWAFACLVLGPVYALSWVPERFDPAQDEGRSIPGLNFIVNWIAAPMVLLYVLILYAYFLKILIEGAVPNGHLAYLISGFAGAGVVTYLAGWGVRENAGPLLRLFTRVFFPALIIPVGFHFYAIWERVGAYGITEQRYMLILSAVWFLIIALSFTFFRRVPLKALPGTLAALFLLGSFGAWGGVSVSGYSQFSRLEALLVKHDLLVEGKVVKSEQDIPFDDRLSISSILDYLCQSEREYMIAPWFHDVVKESKTEDWNCSGYNLTEHLGFKHVSRWERQNEINGRFWLNRGLDQGEPQDIRGYDFLARSRNSFKGCKDNGCAARCALEDGRALKVLLKENGVLVVRIEDEDILEVDLKPVVRENVGQQDSAKPLFLAAENDRIAVRFNFSYINGEMKDDELRIDNVSYDLLYRMK